MSKTNATNRIKQAHGILNKAVRDWEPIKVYACFSGGNDSIVSTHLAMNYFKDATVLHINTGIGLRETREHVYSVVKQYNWPFLEVHAKEDCGQDYEDLVCGYGFPGAGHHRKMYNRLKERAIRLALKKAKEGHSRRAKVLFISGIYATESNVRAGYSRAISKVAAQIWVNPCYWWVRSDMVAYRRHYRLPKNPVSEKLGISGECLCGAYADGGERVLLKKHFPYMHEYLAELEGRVKQQGHNWNWHDAGRPSVYDAREQAGQLSAFTPLCHGCGKSA